MATRWSDQDIAATLNRMGLPTGQNKTWTAHRVSSIRRVRGVRAYRSAEKNGEWLTLREAAERRGVTSHRIRKLINAGILHAEQVVPGAPFQIRASSSHFARPPDFLRGGSCLSAEFEGGQGRPGESLTQQSPRHRRARRLSGFPARPNSDSTRLCRSWIAFSIPRAVAAGLCLTRGGV